MKIQAVVSLVVEAVIPTSVPYVVAADGLLTVSSRNISFKACSRYSEGYLESKSRMDNKWPMNCSPGILSRAFRISMGQYESTQCNRGWKANRAKSSNTRMECSKVHPFINTVDAINAPTISGQ